MCVHVCVCVYCYTHIVLVIYVERLTDKKKPTTLNGLTVTFTHMLHL